VNVYNWLRKQRHKLIHNRDTPEAVALGFAVGIFWGFSPLWGLKTLLSAGFAKLLRGNVVAAIVGVTLHEIILPLVPLLLKFEYQIGKWVLTGSTHGHVIRILPHGADLLKWSTYLEDGKPLLLGSLVLGVPAGIIAYWITRPLVVRWRITHGHRPTEQEPSPVSLEVPPQVPPQVPPEVPPEVPPVATPRHFDDLPPSPPTKSVE
jgi:uncharacterized protein (DUF2062 family)